MAAVAVKLEQRRRQLRRLVGNSASLAKIPNDLLSRIIHHGGLNAVSQYKSKLPSIHSFMLSSDLFAFVCNTEGHITPLKNGT